MLVSDIHECIRQVVLAKHRAREFSQAELSEKLGIKQAHLSNVLLGNRGFSIEVMDKALRALKLEVEDLLPSEQLGTKAERHAEAIRVPRIELQFAMRPSLAKKRLFGTVSYRSKFIQRLKIDCSTERKSWMRFIAIEIPSDVRDAMYPRFGNGAVSLIDRHYTSLKPHQNNAPNLYLVRKGNEYLIRHIEMQDTVLCLRPQGSSHPLDFVQITQKRPIESCVVGRVAHIGAEV